MENKLIQKLLDVNPDPAFIVEKKTGWISFYNRLFKNESGIPDTGIKNIFDITVPSEKEKLLLLLNRGDSEEDFHLQFGNNKLSRYRISFSGFDDDKVICTFKEGSDQLVKSMRYKLFNMLNDAVIATDINMNIISWNKTAERIYGWSETEAVGKNLNGLLMSEITESGKNIYTFELEKNGRSKMTVIQRHKNGQPVFIESHVYVMNDHRGKISGYVSVNRDISVRIETLRELQRTEERYRQLFDENPLPIIIYKEADYSILNVNKASVNKFGYTEKQLLKLKVPDLQENKDDFIKMISADNQAGKRKGVSRSVNKRGELIQLEYSSTKIKYKEFDARLVVLNDITEKRKAEERLFESKTQLNTIVDNLPLVLLEPDEKGKLIFREGKALSDAGFKPDVIVGKSVYKAISDIMITRNNGEYIAIDKVVERVMKGEMIAGHSTISDRHFDNYFVPVKKKGTITGFLGIFLDITQRVNLEKSKHITDEKFLLIAENTSELISMSSNNAYIYLSPSYERILGYTLEEIGKLGPYSFLHPDDKPLFNYRGTKGMLEFRLKNKNGDWLWMEGERFSIPGNPEIVVGIAREINKRKLAEKALKDSEKRYRLLFEHNPQPMFVYDQETFQFLAVNEAAINHYGYKKDEFLNMTIMDIRPKEDAGLLLDFIKDGLSGMRKFGGWRHIKKNGEIIEVDITSHNISFGLHRARIVLANDITQKVKAEKALMQSEEKYRRIVENANEGIWLFDDKWSTTFVNSKLADILGYKVQEMENEQVFKFLFKEDVKKVGKYLRKIREGNLETIKLRLKHKGGIEKWVISNAVPILSDDMVFTGSLALVTDMTSQKKAEVILQHTNEMLKALINCSPLSIIILDKKGNIELWNPASEKMFGWSSKEVIGKPLPYRSGGKGKDKNELVNFVLEGNSFTGQEVSRVTKNGDSIDVSISASPMFDSNEKTIGIASFLMDITEKKLAEKEREKLFREINDARKRLKLLSARLLSIQEDEKRNVARELHDEIGQILTAIKIDLQRIKNESSPDDTILLIEDCTSLVDKTISIVRDLSHELRPSVLDDLGLAAALKWYIERFSQRTGINVKTEIKKIDKLIPPEDVINLYRVCQEALTNVAKHSLADYVKVSLKLENDNINLSIEDNGKGFEAEKALKLAAKGESLGLLSMQERVGLINGKLKIISSRNSGTKIKVMCQI